jgi:hypothetical protein
MSVSSTDVTLVPGVAEVPAIPAIPAVTFTQYTVGLDHTTTFETLTGVTLADVIGQMSENNTHNEAAIGVNFSTDTSGDLVVSADASMSTGQTLTVYINVLDS